VRGPTVAINTGPPTVYAGGGAVHASRRFDGVLSVIVLLPLAAIGWQAAGGGCRPSGSRSPRKPPLESFRVTMTIAVGVTVINVSSSPADSLRCWYVTTSRQAAHDAVIDLRSRCQRCGQAGNAGPSRDQRPVGCT